MLLVDKPAGLTSHDVVAAARRSLRVRRVGHTGTLDPFATGLLVLLVGRGTRLLPYVEGEPKVYDAVLSFGAETDTDDPTGTVVRQADVPRLGAVRTALTTLTGALDQIPPAYSAKKVEGTRAYAAARRGGSLVLPSARVVVHSWEVRGELGDGLENAHWLDVRIVCSGGTYIRALARDLGRLSGSAAHLTALRRVRSGPFDVADAITIDELDLDVRLRPLRHAVPSMSAVTLDAPALARVLHGNPVRAASETAAVDGARVALVDESGVLVGVAERHREQLRPRIVLRDA